MAKTESNEFKVGKIAPDFNLMNTVDDKHYALNEQHKILFNVRIY